MTVEQIHEAYKKYCTKLESAEMLLLKDIESLKDLARFCEEEKITDDEIISAFKRANKSDFLCGKKTTFKADIKWMCNPVNLEKINNGNYDDHKSLDRKPQSREYDFDELERQQHEKQQQKLEVIRKDKEHQEWLESEWYVKYPNMRI